MSTDTRKIYWDHFSSYKLALSVLKLLQPCGATAVQRMSTKVVLHPNQLCARVGAALDKVLCKVAASRSEEEVPEFISPTWMASERAIVTRITSSNLRGGKGPLPPPSLPLHSILSRPSVPPALPLPMLPPACQGSVDWDRVPGSR